MNKLLVCVAMLFASGAYGADIGATSSSAPSPAGAPSAYQVDFGPYIGSGAASTGAKVRSTSGYSLAVERAWPLGAGLSLAPHMEVANGFVNTRNDAQAVHEIATYDNRIFAAGLKLSQQLGSAASFAPSLYLSGVAGRGFSKLSVDESTDRTYAQSLYNNISGDYFAGELGTWIPLKGNFGIDLSFLASLYRANQADATYTQAGNKLNPADDSISLVEKTGAASDGSISRSVDLKTYAAKIGLSLGF